MELQKFEEINIYEFWDEIEKVHTTGEKQKIGVYKHKNIYITLGDE